MRLPRRDPVHEHAGRQVVPLADARRQDQDARRGHREASSPTRGPDSVAEREVADALAVVQMPALPAAAAEEDDVATGAAVDLAVAEVGVDDVVARAAPDVV